MQAMVAEDCFLKKGEDRFPGAVVRETEAAARAGRERFRLDSVSGFLSGDRLAE